MSWLPCAIRSSLKRTSWPEAIASSPKRTASAPYAGNSPPCENTGGRGPPAIRSSGSTPVPSDLLIRRPSGAWITEWTLTSVNGISPRNSSPIITMRATQRNRMSRAVDRTSVG